MFEGNDPLGAAPVGSGCLGCLIFVTFWVFAVIGFVTVWKAVF